MNAGDSTMTRQAELVGTDLKRFHDTECCAVPQGEVKAVQMSDRTVLVAIGGSPLLQQGERHFSVPEELHLPSIGL
jgi:hypothetical protein